MALVIENGSIVTGANSYATRADYIAYAAAEGVTIADNDTADQQLVQAARYIDSLETRLKGYRVSRDQPLAFPRYELWIEDYAWNSDEIPRQVINAQIELALDINAGISLYNPPQSESIAVKREKIDRAVEVEYAVGNQSPITRRSKSLRSLAALMKGNGLLSVALVMS